MDISTVNCTLVGISCLNEQVHSHVEQMWNNRFYENETVLIKAESGQDKSILMKNINEMIKTNGIGYLGGKTLIMTLFLDLTKSLDENLLDVMLEAADAMRKTYGCSVPLIMEFGYIDELLGGDLELYQQNAKQIVLKNAQDPGTRRQLCLVSPASWAKKEDDLSWKAVSTLLDVLRRVSAPASIIPVAKSNANNDISFLRYGEFRSARRDILIKRIEELRAALGDGGEPVFKDALQKALRKIEKDIEMTFEVCGDLQPIHPGILHVDSGFLGCAKRKAKKGKNPKFNEARVATLDALNLTATRMLDEMDRVYGERIKAAAKHLEEMLACPGIGIGLIADPQRMNRLMQIDIPHVPSPMPPQLPYMEDGYRYSINNYLLDLRKYKAAEIKQAYLSQLLEAYRNISPEDISKKRDGLAAELMDSNKELVGLGSKADFIDRVTQRKDLPGTFMPVNPDGARRDLVLCRCEQDRQELIRSCADTEVTSYYINEIAGGIRVLDDAPIKAIQMLLFDCTEQRLKDLIK